MRVDIDALEEVDKLGPDLLPGLDADEWIGIRTIKDYQTALEAETHAGLVVVRVEPSEDDPEPDPERQVNFPEFHWQLFDRFVTGWQLYRPAAKGQKRREISDSPENRRKIFKVYGKQVVAEINRRDGGIAPAIPAGKVGPDGEALTFPQADPVGDQR